MSPTSISLLIALAGVVVALGGGVAALLWRVVSLGTERGEVRAAVRTIDDIRAHGSPQIRVLETEVACLKDRITVLEGPLAELRERVARMEGRSRSPD